MQELHEDQLGAVKMKRLARGNFWWPNLEKAIKVTAKVCVMCSITQPDSPKRWLDRSKRRLYLDYLDPFQGSMLRVAVDVHSKWEAVIPIFYVSATTTVDILMTMLRYGIP